MSYEELERERPPKRARDWTDQFELLPLVANVNSDTGVQVERFCASKRITVEALTALGARVHVDRSRGLALAFAGHNHDGRVVAVKYRPLNGSSHDSWAENPSVWVRPIIVGNRGSLDWLVVEGETDGARLWGLVGDTAAVMVLPAGARTFRREWAALIPRGAAVGLCHDADEDGDQGADKAAKILGGQTFRVRPPIEGGDWCDWNGGRTEFLEIAQGARDKSARLRVLPATDFLAVEYPHATVLLGSAETIIYLARGAFLLVYGDGGSGKSTLTLDAAAHLAAGRDWLGVPVPRPARVVLIENEGAAQLFQTKLRDKAEQWDIDPAWLDNIFVYTEPWGGFTFANAHTRETLREFCDEHQIDVLVANPLFGVGGPGSGRPDETSAFIDWLKELGLGLGGPAVWLLHHENKLGQVSGDWNRQPDTLISLARDGDNERTKLKWEKTRWANRTPEGWRQKWLLEWVTEHKGYRLLDVDIRGATDEELIERLDAYLGEHPWASTNALLQAVEGDDKRLRSLLKSGRYTVKQGPRSSNLYALGHDLGGTPPTEPPTLTLIPHE